MSSTHRPTRRGQGQSSFVKTNTWRIVLQEQRFYCANSAKPQRGVNKIVFRSSFYQSSVLPCHLSGKMRDQERRVCLLRSLCFSVGLLLLWPFRTKTTANRRPPRTTGIGLDRRFQKKTLKSNPMTRPLDQRGLIPVREATNDCAAVTYGRFHAPERRVAC